MAIEIAWCWLQYQPQSASSAWYQRLWGKGNSRQRRIGVVTVLDKSRFIEAAERTAYFVRGS